MVAHDFTAAPTDGNTTLTAPAHTSGNLPAPIEPTAVEQRPTDIILVPHAVDPNLMVPVRREHLPTAPAPAAPPRDLTPQPVLDPRAQVMAAGGLLAAGTGYGIAQIVNALAGLGSGVLLGLALALVAAKTTRPGPVTHVRNETRVEVTNHARWFGRNTTNASL